MGERVAELAERALAVISLGTCAAFGGISAAATFGWSAGENAAKYAKAAKAPDLKRAKTDIEAKKASYETLLSRSGGTNYATWQEVNYTLQQLMFDYCGYIRSAVNMEAGMDNIKRLRTKANKLLAAANSHELVHCLETLNLVDLGELVMIGANDRKETRGNHKRADYTLTNPLVNDKRHMVKLVNGKPTCSWDQIN